MPSVGKLPYGRTFDRKTESWGIDKAKQRVVQEVARRYLAGELMADLAREFGMNGSALHKTVMHRCGSVWSQRFAADDLDIKETIKIEDPGTAARQDHQGVAKACGGE